MVLEKKAPLKKRYARYNQVKFMNKYLQNSIMNRCRLINRFGKEKTEATTTMVITWRLRIFYVLPNFPFTTNETKPDY